jgi:uncharacterized protein (AIM24 family)
MRYEINGTTLPTLEVRLNSGESVYTESGGMAWMKGNIEMKTDTKGGLMKGLGRALSGESLFMSTYTSHEEGALIVFARKRPAKSSILIWRRVRASSARRTPSCARRTASN